MEIIIITNDGGRIIIPASATPIQLTSSESFNTFVNISIKEGKFVIEGGSSLIGEIKGEGMIKKIKG